MNERLLRDMQKHLDNKLALLLHDIAQTCEVGDVPPQHTIALIIGSLMEQVVLAAATMKMNESTFVEMSGIAYRQMIGRATKMVKKTEEKNNE